MEVYELITERLNGFKAELERLEKSNTIVYQEEQRKTELRAKVGILQELLTTDTAKPDSERDTYRVELVDYIDAHSEHEAIEIFVKAIPEIDLSDDNFDVYKVDSLTHKAVR